MAEEKKKITLITNLDGKSNTAEEPAKPETSTVRDNDKSSDDPKELFIKKIKQSLYTEGESGEQINVSTFINSVITNAIDARASDIHIEPEESRLVVRFRIDGILREVLSLDKNIEQVLLFKLKITAKLPTDEHFAPQDGRIGFNINDKKIDTRLSILPTVNGEKVVIRLLTSEGNSYALEDLGIVGNDLETVKRSYSKPYGMILAVGPTGSGKTTTLYSVLKILNTREVNITTVEDPVEYNISGVNQVQINSKVDLTFANGLRAILRQDPNIIMIGEIRDAETAKIAINAAMTGHLVLSTLHTNDAITTIPRLIDMGVEPFLIASTVNVIIAQRLARRLCSKCKVEYKLSDKEFEDLNRIRPDIATLLKAGTAIYKEGSCKECSTGFKGRVGLYEILEIHETLRRIITENGNIDDLFKQARKEGLVLIVEDGIKKLKQGVTSLSELIRVTALKE